jgi:hypothetical protein
MVWIIIIILGADENEPLDTAAWNGPSTSSWWYMGIKQWWKDNWQGKTEVHGEEPASVPSFHSQIPYILYWIPRREADDYLPELGYVLWYKVNIPVRFLDSARAIGHVGYPLLSVLLFPEQHTINLNDGRYTSFSQPLEYRTLFTRSLGPNFMVQWVLLLPHIR